MIGKSPRPFASEPHLSKWGPTDPRDHLPRARHLIGWITVPPPTMAPPELPVDSAPAGQTNLQTILESIKSLKTVIEGLVSEVSAWSRIAFMKSEEMRMDYVPEPIHEAADPFDA